MVVESIDAISRTIQRAGHTAFDALRAHFLKALSSQEMDGAGVKRKEGDYTDTSIPPFERWGGLGLKL